MIKNEFWTEFVLMIFEQRIESVFMLIVVIDNLVFKREFSKLIDFFVVAP